MSNLLHIYCKGFDGFFCPLLCVLWSPTETSKRNCTTVLVISSEGASDFLLYFSFFQQHTEFLWSRNAGNYSFLQLQEIRLFCWVKMVSKQEILSAISWSYFDFCWYNWECPKNPWCIVWCTRVDGPVLLPIST